MKKLKNLFWNIITIIVVIMYLLLLLVVGVNAESSLGIIKQNDCINLIQTCSNCTYNNISSVLYPSSNQALGQVAMTKIGTKFNYTFCNTNPIGTYIVNGFGDVDGVTTVWAYDFEVSPTGSSNLLGFYIIALIIPWLLFLLGLWKKDMTFAVFGTIGFYVVALYLLIMGIDGVKDWLSNGIGVIHLGVAFYTSIRYTLESIDVNW